MRKVTFGCAASLDNFIAREDGSYDWIMHSNEAMQVMAEYWPKIDTMIMGRKTWEVAQANMPRSKKARKAFEDMHVGITSYVFSRTEKPGTRDGVTYLNDDPAKFVLKLKRQKGKEICIMSGGDLARGLLEAGVIDEIGFNIQPVLLGSGVPLFHKMSRQIDLERIDLRAFKNGCFYVLYRVKR